MAPAETRLISRRYIMDHCINLIFRQLIYFCFFFTLLDGRCYGNDDFKYPSSSASLWVAITKLAGCIAHIGRKNNWQLLYSVRFLHSLLFRHYALYPKVKSVHGLCRLPLAWKNIGVFFRSQNLKKWNSVRTEEISQVSGSKFHVISRKIYELTQTHPKIQTIWLIEKRIVKFLLSFLKIFLSHHI